MFISIKFSGDFTDSSVALGRNVGAVKWPPRPPTPFKGSPVSTATGVGALPSRDTVRFTTAAWASGKKSKWPPGSRPGWERVGCGLQ